MIPDALLPYIHHPYFPHLLAIVLTLFVLLFVFRHLLSKLRKPRKITKNQQRKDTHDKKKVGSAVPSSHVTQESPTLPTKASGDPIRTTSVGVGSPKNSKQPSKEPIAHSKLVEVPSSQLSENGESQWITVDKNKKDAKGSPGTSNKQSVESKPPKSAGYYQSSSGDTMINTGKWKLLESLSTEELIDDVIVDNFDNIRRPSKGARYRRKD